MYKCLDCGHIFEEGEELKIQEERGEFWGVKCHEEMLVCPVCKGSFEESYPCENCGTHEKNSNDYFCEDCKNDIKKRFQELIHSNFDENEIKAINEMYDGEWIE